MTNCTEAHEYYKGLEREKILAMKPGRELDVAIAERVFGWIVENNRCLIGGTVNCSEREWMRLKRYSTDISAAWEVVEKLGKYCFAEIRRLHRATGIGEAGEWRWHAGLCREDSGQCHWAAAETAPEAICKAALLACLEVE